MFRIIGICSMLVLTSCASPGRLLEPGRTQLMLSGIMQGIPVTAILCIESQLVKGGVKRIEEASPLHLQRASAACAEALSEKLNREIMEEMTRVENQEAARKDAEDFQSRI